MRLSLTSTIKWHRSSGAEILQLLVGQPASFVLASMRQLEREELAGVEGDRLEVMLRPERQRRVVSYVCRAMG